VILLKLKKGYIVTRKSYGRDILFYIDRIITLRNNTKIAILKGITVRIEADAVIDDLEVATLNRISQAEKRINEILVNRLNRLRKENRNYIIKKGTILHLDGDRRYSIKSSRYYKKIGLNAVVRNVPECKQPMIVKGLLAKYNPDILIVTGHDAMIRKGKNFDNLYNYRNSRYFISTVQEARKWEKSSDRLVIFAGACQSYYEAIISAGADFASSPDRILIDFTGPLIVAEKMALTEQYKFVTGEEVAKEVREGEKGIFGIGARGKMKRIYTIQ